MVATITWIGFVVGCLALIYLQVSARYWLSLSALLLILFIGYASLWVGLVFGLIWAILLLFILAKDLRLRFFTKPFLSWFKKSQPALTHDEQAVLNAGGLWWEADFFTGRPNWEKLLNQDAGGLTAEEHAFLTGPVEAFCALLDDWKIYQENDLPVSAWDFMKRERLWGLCIEKKYGGLGFSAAAHSAIVTKIASRCMSAAITVMVPNSLGPATFIEQYGTQAQKEYYLPRLAQGDEIACFALTSSVAGSDATSIIDTGVVCFGEYQNQKCLGIKLNFAKRYITLAPVCTLIGLAFKLFDPDHLLGQEVNLGLTNAMIPAHFKGVEVGDRHYPMTLPFMNGPVKGCDVFIPMEFVFGAEAGLGRGWEMMMECLSLGRGLSLPSLATAANKVCFRVSSAYATARRQFKQPLYQFEGISAVLAEIGGFTYLADATRQFTAHAVDAGARPSIASAIAKYHLTELARKTVNHAMDIHGGKAIQRGPHNYLASLYNAIPISITVEGANILTRNLIIFGQGVVRCHPYLAREMKIAAAVDQEQSLTQFDTVLLQHLGFILSCGVRTLVYGLTGGRCILTGKRGRVAPYLKQLTRMSAAFALLTDVTLIILGAKLKFKESLSARFADVLSHLYLAAAVLKHYHTSSFKEQETPFMAWSVTYCLARIQHSIDEITTNYPKKFIGKLLRRLIFPFGQAYKMPTDVQAKHVAALMVADSPLRNHLLDLTYVGAKSDSIAALEAVFKQTEQANKLLKLIPNSHCKSDPDILTEVKQLVQAKQISQEDAERLERFLRARMASIDVDEFTTKRGLHETATQDIRASNEST